MYYDDEYDERSGIFQSQGSHYGVGKRQPVGTEKQTGANPIPFGTNHPFEKVENEEKEDN